MLGRALGPAINAGNEMAQWGVVRSGEIIPFVSCRPLTDAEQHSPTEKRKRDESNDTIRARHGDSINMSTQEDDLQVNDDIGETLESCEDEEETPRVIPDADDNVYDTYVNTELQLPNGDHMENARVVKRHKNHDGQYIGRRHDNPILDTRVYDVEFNDGSVKQYSANVIAENMFSQVDADGYHYLLLDVIIDHRSNDQVVRK